MHPKQHLLYGNQTPFDAPNEWWFETGKSEYDATPKDWAHSAARGIIHDLQDRHTIKHALDVQKIDEETREEIVATMAAIIREAANNPDQPRAKRVG